MNHLKTLSFYKLISQQVVNMSSKYGNRYYSSPIYGKMSESSTTTSSTGEEEDPPKNAENICISPTFRICREDSRPEDDFVQECYERKLTEKQKVNEFHDAPPAEPQDLLGIVNHTTRRSSIPRPILSNRNFRSSPNESDVGGGGDHTSCPSQLADHVITDQLSIDNSSNNAQLPPTEEKAPLNFVLKVFGIQFFIIVMLIAQIFSINKESHDLQQQQSAIAETNQYMLKLTLRMEEILAQFGQSIDEKMSLLPSNITKEEYKLAVEKVNATVNLFVAKFGCDALSTSITTPCDRKNVSKWKKLECGVSHFYEWILENCFRHAN